jgi:predicted alpha-1,2-mannosidase
MTRLFTPTPRVRYSFVAAFIGLIASSAGWGQPAQLADYVNTLQGTNSRFELTHGNTLPAAALPFGMHMWTPQTGRNGDGWKYQYEKDTIRGFQQSHQCSSWSNDYAVFSFMPVVGELVVDEDRRATKFRHADETARPYHYRVRLASGVVAELAPTERGAFLRFEFPQDRDSYVVFDGYTGRCSLEIRPEEGKIVGQVRNGRSIPRNFANHFTATFDCPIVAYGTWRRRGRNVEANDRTISGWRIGAYLQFERGATVNVKVASSYISATQAEMTLDRELRQFKDFGAARDAAREVWNRHLDRVVVEGGTEEQMRTFYSCLFRASLFPRFFFEYDANGKPHYFSPYDGTIHSGYMYTDTGLWDTFRAQMPLRTILWPEMHGRYMQSLLAAYRECGWLPSWSFPGEAGSMIGNHAMSLLADAWVKGIRTFEPHEALAAYQHESTNDGRRGPANGRRGWEEIERLGYLPYPEYHEATAKTLEYAYDDFCGFQLARLSGNVNFQRVFSQRMFNYRNVYDPTVGFMRGKNERGRWTPDFDPIEWGGPFTEGCGWHWLWSVFHDVAGLIELMGGDEAFVAKLDAVFEQPSDFKVGTYGAPIHEMREMVLADLGQYAHGNQPMQHMIYLYNYAGQPWKAQRRVRTVMDRLYKSTEDGYLGDEDEGQTSAWYVLSALGFYSVCPGTDEYVFGSPLFPKATIHQENGRPFVIEAHGNGPDNVYIQSAHLNGKQYTRNYIRHADILNGGRLDFQMGPRPDRDRGTSHEDRPFSVSEFYVAQPAAKE